MVTIGGVSQGTFPGVSRLAVFGGSGNDTILVTGRVAVPAELYGGDSNDTLQGGLGVNILVGGDGDDTLTGNGARDLLIGGSGADKLNGGGAGDLLLAGGFDGGQPPDVLQATLRQVTTGWIHPQA